MFDDATEFPNHRLASAAFAAHRCDVLSDQEQQHILSLNQRIGRAKHAWSRPSPVSTSPKERWADYSEDGWDPFAHFGPWSLAPISASGGVRAPAVGTVDPWAS